MEENQENKNEQIDENVQNETNEQNNENTQNEAGEQNGLEANDKTVILNYSSEELKNETKQTVEQIKETIKSTDLKKDSKVAKGFFSSFFKNPLEEVEKCASDNKSSFLKIAIITLLVWLISLFISEVFSIANRYIFGAYGSFSYFFRNLLPNILDIIKGLVAPIISIAVLSSLIYLFNKKKDKSFLTIASTIVVAHIPVVVANIVNLLTIFGSGISKITSCFSSFCSILYYILLYFAIKHLSGESENKSYFWKFALIIGIFYVAKFIFSYLGIYL